MKLKRIVTLLTTAVMLASVTSFGPSQLSPTAAADSCITPYHMAAPPAVSTKPSTSIGVMGHRPPAAHQPSWNGNDRINDMVYNKNLNIIVAAGEFDSYIWHGKTYARHNIMSFDATTGAPTSFAPNVDGEIMTVALSCGGTGVYIGGHFTHVNGVARSYAAKVAFKGNQLMEWNPHPNSYVEDINMAGSHVIISGYFSKIGNVARTAVASVNQTTGGLTNWLHLTLAGHDPVGPLKVTKVIPNNTGTYAIMIGNFNSVNGHAHRRIAMLHLTSSAAGLNSWATAYTASNNNSNDGTDCSTNYPSPELDVAWTPNNRQFITVSTGSAHLGSICDTATKWDATKTTDANAKPMAQQITGGDTLSAVVCSNANCWASGHNRWANNPPLHPLVTVKPCSAVSPTVSKAGHAGYNCKGPHALDRPGLIGMSLSNMQATSWNPTRSKQRGMHNTMILTPQGLWIGSDGDYAGNNTGSATVANLPHNDLVLFPFTK